MTDESTAPGVASRGLMAAVRGYQKWVSPLLPPSCRFYPSCSQYAVEALQVHGALKGSGYAALRLLKCGPWHRGGVDFVKPRKPARRSHSGPDGTARTSDPLTNHGAS